MEEAINPLPASPALPLQKGEKRRNWIRETSSAVGDGPKIAFALFVAFLLMLYSNVAVIYKAQLDAVRPTLVVALCALFAPLTLAHWPGTLENDALVRLRASCPSA